MTTATTNPGYIENKDNLLTRLRRVSGQVGGLERMVEDERYCIDILTQVSAIQAALDKVALALLDDHVRHCVVGATEENRDEKRGEMMGAVGRLIRSR
jgi:DNA-binding FrmR family transcriptional regulator